MKTYCFLGAFCLLSLPLFVDAQLAQETFQTIEETGVTLDIKLLPSLEEVPFQISDSLPLVTEEATRLNNLIKELESTISATESKLKENETQLKDRATEIQDLKAKDADSKLLIETYEKTISELKTNEQSLKDAVDANKGLLASYIKDLFLIKINKLYEYQTTIQKQISQFDTKIKEHILKLDETNNAKIQKTIDSSYFEMYLRINLLNTTLQKTNDLYQIVSKEVENISSQNTKDSALIEAYKEYYDFVEAVLKPEYSTIIAIQEKIDKNVKDIKDSFKKAQYKDFGALPNFTSLVGQREIVPNINFLATNTFTSQRRDVYAVKKRKYTKNVNKSLSIERQKELTTGPKEVLSEPLENIFSKHPKWSAYQYEKFYKDSLKLRAKYTGAINLFGALQNTSAASAPTQAKSFFIIDASAFGTKLNLSLFLYEPEKLLNQQPGFTVALNYKFNYLGKGFGTDTTKDFVLDLIHNSFGPELLLFDGLSVYANANVINVVGNTSEFAKLYPNYQKASLFADYGVKSLLKVSGNDDLKVLMDLNFIIMNGDIRTYIKNEDVLIPTFKIGLRKTF